MYIKGNNLKYAQMIDKIKIKQQAQRRDWLTHDSTHHYYDDMLPTEKKHCHNTFHMLSHVSCHLRWAHLPDSPGRLRKETLTGAGHGGTRWWRRRDACCLTWWWRLRPLGGHWGSETLQGTASGRVSYHIITCHQMFLCCLETWSLIRRKTTETQADAHLLHSG